MDTHNTQLCVAVAQLYPHACEAMLYNSAEILPAYQEPLLEFIQKQLPRDKNLICSMLAKKICQINCLYEEDLYNDLALWFGTYVLDYDNPEEFVETMQTITEAKAA